jgi:pyruvate carboxylase
MPDYGKIIAYRSASGFGVRLDAGTAAVGSVVTPYYDSLLVKVTSWAKDVEECRCRMDRALREFRIRGVKTNLVFLETLINHKSLINFNYNTRFIDTEKSLHSYKLKKDRASKILNFLGNIIVNGNKEIFNRPAPDKLIKPFVPSSDFLINKSDYASLLEKEGPIKFTQWIKKQNQLFITDTTMRDAHQSLLATRMRSDDIVNIAEYYSTNLSQFFSIECWGGATFDVSMRFLKEDPWQRLADIKSKAPNILTQMLFRGSNAVGYKNYPDNVVKFFIQEAVQAGIDVFRIFDSLNWSENMQVAIEEVCKHEKLCEGAICYTNDLSDPDEKKYTLKYYLDIAKKLEKMGAHIIAIKDMAGLCKPEAANILIKGLKETTDLPIHFHTHDTSGTSAASILSAAKAGVDIIDLAMDSMSGLTSQPAMGSIINALNSTKRKTTLNENNIRTASLYWEEVRQNYRAFESDFKGGSSDVYLHQMPGGQFTNLKEQARSLGISLNRWGLVAKIYADVNKMFGDIIKVTPSSKVVGDMTLFMITNDLSVDEVLDPKKEITFPQSVVEFFRGDLGIPYGGFPKELQKKVLKDIKPIFVRPGSIMPDVNLEKEKKELMQKINRNVTSRDLASYLMYPSVFLDFEKHQNKYGNLSVLSTPSFFYGPKLDQEFSLRIEKGKSLILRYLTKSNTNKEGKCSVFFELNGQPRTIVVDDEQVIGAIQTRKKADSGNIKEIGSPLPGQISQIQIKSGDNIIKGDKLFVIEAMKMETVVYAERSSVVKSVELNVGDNVETKDLLITFK